MSLGVAGADGTGLGVGADREAALAEERHFGATDAHGFRLAVAGGLTLAGHRRDEAAVLGNRNQICTRSNEGWRAVVGQHTHALAEVQR